MKPRSSTATPAVELRHADIRDDDTEPLGGQPLADIPAVTQRRHRKIGKLEHLPDTGKDVRVVVDQDNFNIWFRRHFGRL